MTPHMQHCAPGLQTIPLFSKPCSPHSLGEPSTWPQVSYSSQVSLHSTALPWYARILSTALEFYFSNTCYFTFKLGHQWRTEGFFCIPILSDEGGVVSAFPQVWSVCLFMHELKLSLHITLIFMKLLDYLKQSIHLLLASFHPWVIPHKVVDCTLPHCLQIPFSLYISYLCRQLSSHQSQKNTKYPQWSVTGFCLMGVHRFQSSTGCPHWLHFPWELCTK